MPQRKEKRRPAPVAAPTKRHGSKLPVAQQSGPKRNWGKLALQVGAAVLVAAFVYFIASGVGTELSGVPDGVRAVAVGEAQHIEGEIDYEGHPAGGPHNAIWQNCGAYSVPVEEENAVHSLEHGAVWITYPLGASQDVIDRLEGFAGRNKVLVSPVEGQTVPIIVTSWGNQMDVQTADDPRIAQYVTEFAGSADAPEPGGACTGGVGVPG